MICWKCFVLFTCSLCLLNRERKLVSSHVILYHSRHKKKSKPVHNEAASTFSNRAYSGTVNTLHMDSVPHIHKLAHTHFQHFCCHSQLSNNTICSYTKDASYQKCSRTFNQFVIVICGFCVRSSYETHRILIVNLFVTITYDSNFFQNTLKFTK